MCRGHGVWVLWKRRAMKISKNHIVRNKLAYARGERPAVDCILCAVAQDDPLVDNLVIFRRDGWYITLNLYPYNPAHVMIVPERHCTDPRELSEEEALQMHRMQALTLNVLEREYRPDGFNIGYNVGRSSGASIDHLHLQIVPRYPSEVGFFDILSDSRVIVEEPRTTLKRLRAAFAEAEKDAKIMT